MVGDNKIQKSINRLIDTQQSAQKSDKLNYRVAADKTKQPEDYLRYLIEKFPDGIISTNINGIITLCNKAFAEIIGLPKAKIIGKNFLRLSTLQTNKSEEIFTIFNSIGKDKMIEPFEFEWIHRDGALHSAEVSFTLLKDSENTLGIQVVAHDITKYKIKYEQMKIANQHLYQTQKLESIGMLAGGIAHDFNNLLASILGNISLAKMIVNSDNKISNILNRAEKVSIQAKDLIQQLMFFTKCSEPIKIPVLISETIKNATEFALRGSNNNYELSVSDLLLPVEADESQLTQAFINIIIHANKQMSRSGTIKIRAENVTITKTKILPLNEGVYVKITIKDQGVSLTKEKVDQIFDPFYATKPNGPDLGLKIANSIIKEYGGYFIVESQIEIGNTYTVYLPACLKEVSKSNETKEERKQISGSQNGKKILVMDDEPEVREIISSILTHYGYTVKCTSNGSEMIDNFKRAKESGEPFTAVIIDLTIKGGMGGKETINELIKLEPKVKAIVASGYSNNPIMTDFSKYGFCGVITKPFRVEELINKLQQVLIEK
jgi:PAS domain S-box-containing protein